MPSENICKFCDKVRNHINNRKFIGLPTYGAIEVYIKEFSPEPLYIEVKNGTVFVEPYDYKNKDATICLDMQTFYDIYHRNISIKDALDSQKVIVDGDAEILYCLQRNM